MMRVGSYEGALLLLLGGSAGMEILVAVLEAEEVGAVRTIVVIDGEEFALAGCAEVLLLLHLKQLSPIDMFHAPVRLLRPVVLVTELHEPTPTSLLHFLQR
jgi:hypothetical protein